MRIHSFLLSTLMGLAACSDGGGAPEPSWLDNGHDTYAFTLTRACECDGAAKRITVEHGVVVAATYIDSQAPVADLASVPTIEELFTWIEEAKEVEATYDPTLGYPVDVTLDRSKIIADGGQEFHVRDVQLN